MATTTLDANIDSTLGTRKRWRRATTAQTGVPVGSVTTYCYRTSLGVRGTATSTGAIPVGSEIERTLTG